ANLVISGLDLSMCLFVGASRLEQLRLEGAVSFARPPAGLVKFGRLPIRWRWSSRQVVAEEAYWRSMRRPSWDGVAPDPAAVQTLLTSGRVPERLAAVYRSLRKAEEDSKNEPGAADFYYGEMEMRRHAATTTRAERFILKLYWLISGYGLRATRALT